MNISDDDKVFDDINVTPMLDLAYVLLIIFIILTTATVQGIKVNLPQASNAPSLNKPQTKAVTITQDGSIFLWSLRRIPRFNTSALLMCWTCSVALKLRSLVW
jgi:biopolymer transport protein ExbD